MKNMKEATLRQSVKILSLFSETPVEQIQAILESGLLADLRDGNITQTNRNDFRRVLGLKVLSAEVPKEIEKLLDFVGTSTIPARTEKFIARDHFIIDTTEKAKVKISYLGDSFKTNFLGKVEEPIVETVMRFGKLLKSSVDNPIINELGGEEKAESALAEMFSLMEMQPNGEDGVLLTNGYLNIFYTRNGAGVLWAVRCSWHVGGWSVVANSVGAPGEWYDGRQVFSRNPFESQS